MGKELHSAIDAFVEAFQVRFHHELDGRFIEMIIPNWNDKDLTNIAGLFLPVPTD
jgi:hypothetical protein